MWQTNSKCVWGGGAVCSKFEIESLIVAFIEYGYTRQALLQLHVNDQLVNNYNDCRLLCLMLVIICHGYPM